MKFEGLKQQAVCKDDGLWSIPTPRCLAPCLVPSIAYGEAEAKLGEKIGHGESLAINCTDNYEVLTLRYSLTSSHHLLSCVGRNFSFSPTFLISYSLFPHLTLFSQVQHEGEPVLCENGNWSQVRNCEEKTDCG